MRKVLKPRLKDLFKYQSSLEEFWDFDRELSIYNPFTFTFFITISFLILGIFHKPSLFLGFSLIIGMLFSLLIAARQADSLRFKRIAPKKGVEYEQVTTRITLQNNSMFPLINYGVFDSFSGSQIGRDQIMPQKKLIPGRKRLLSFKWLADGGMGEKTFRDLLVEVRDPLDFFSFYIHDDDSETISIFPHYEALPTLVVEFNENSFHYGELDIQKRGESINFMGIRDYRKGDPVKRINWRQTARQGKAIINVFERNVNKSIVLIYNNALSLHSGKGAESTEEYCKDLILSIAAENISNGNQLKLMTHDKNTPWGAERAFINRLEMFLIDLKLIETSGAENLIQNSLIKAEKEGVNHSSIIYFTPLIGSPDFEKTFQDILAANSNGVPFQVIGINPYPFVENFFHYGSFSGVKGHIVAVEKLVKKWKPLFKAQGIPFYCLTVNPKSSLYKQLNEARRSFEREI